MIEVRNPEILQCCFYTSDNYWKNRFKELAYKDLKHDTEYYYFDIGDETVKIPKMDPRILSICIINSYHKCQEYSPKEVFEMELIDKLKTNSWTSIKSRNIKDCLLLDYANKSGPETMENVLRVFRGNMRLKNVVMSKNQIKSLDFVPIDDKINTTNKKVSDNNGEYKKYIKKYANTLGTKYKT